MFLLILHCSVLSPFGVKTSYLHFHTFIPIIFLRSFAQAYSNHIDVYLLFHVISLHFFVFSPLCVHIIVCTRLFFISFHPISMSTFFHDIAFFCIVSNLSYPRLYTLIRIIFTFTYFVPRYITAFLRFLTPLRSYTCLHTLILHFYFHVYVLCIVSPVFYVFTHILV